MILFALGIIIGLLIAILDAIYVYKSKSSIIEQASERIARSLPRAKGVLLKSSSQDGWAADIPTAPNYDGKTDTGAS